MLIKNLKVFKHLVELIRSNSEYSKKAEKIQQQADDEYESIKYSLLLNNDHSLINVVKKKSTFHKLMFIWFADVSGLTESQKKLNRELLNILKNFPHFIKENSENSIKN
ncbi:MAG: hypothetical protein ACR5KV_01865 [Wolbachia sp.]